MFSRLLIYSIQWYQRHISPRKGFSCAYRLAYGGSGCSGVGLRLIRRYGVVSGYFLLRKRLARCRFAAQELRPMPPRRNGFATKQRGDCVPDCGGCDGLSCDTNMDLGDCSCFEMEQQLESVCDMAQCSCDCADIFGSRDKEQPKKKLLHTTDDDIKIH